MNPPPRTTQQQYEFIFDAASRISVITKTIRRWIDKMLLDRGSTMTRRAPRRGVIVDEGHTAFRSSFSWTATLIWT